MKIKINTSWYRSKIRIWSNFINYLQHFGWLAVFFILLNVLFYLLFRKWFPVIFLGLIIVTFLTYPTKFVYSLVGAQNSLRSFLLLFIITQLLFSLCYNKEIKTYHNPSTNIVEKSIPYVMIDGVKYVPQSHDIVSSVYTEQNNKETMVYPYRYILLNTFYIGLIQECSPGFQSYIDKPDVQNKDRFFIILNIHIFISWIYLGVLIACLYQKLRNE